MPTVTRWHVGTPAATAAPMARLLWPFGMGMALRVCCPGDACRGAALFSVPSTPVSTARPGVRRGAASVSRR